MRLLILSGLLLTGCATSTNGALSAGPNTFVVSRQAGAFPSGREPLLAEALAEAGSKCSGVGKVMKLVSSTGKPRPVHFGQLSEGYSGLFLPVKRQQMNGGV